MPGRGASRSSPGWGPYSLPRWTNGTRASFHRGPERGGTLCSTAWRGFYFFLGGIFLDARLLKFGPPPRRGTAPNLPPFAEHGGGGGTPAPPRTPPEKKNRTP